MKFALAAENPTLHSEPLEYEIDRMEADFLCSDHEDQKAPRYWWLMHFVRCREECHIDLEMVDV